MVFIRNQDIIFHPSYVEVTLHKTKTAPVIKKFIARIKGNPVDPWRLLHSFKCSRVGSLSKDGPFFISSDGKPVTRSILVKFFRTELGKIFPSIPQNEWNGASLRKGGASSAVHAGVHSEIVEQLGNWRTSEYKKYVHSSVEDILKAQRACASISVPSHLGFTYPDNYS